MKLFSASAVAWNAVCIMKMNIRAQAVSTHASDASEGRVTLTIRPAAPLPGDYSFVTNTQSLRRLLLRTELPSTVLEKFETGMYSPKGANLTAVELSDKTLTQIGYFVD
jgi:hypothetical protein